MSHLVCGGCHGRAAAPVALASSRGARRGGTPHRRASGGAREASRGTANPGVQGYSPPPPPVSPIKGLIDFHTHAAPDIFGRALDDDELATLAATRQMEAVVFKNHLTHTADRAFLVRKHVPGIKVFGGITLNHAVGGPKAVGAQHFVLGTDLGQAGNPTPADGLQMLVAGLTKEGITRDQIATMGRETPGSLLMG